MKLIRIMFVLTSLLAVFTARAGDLDKIILFNIEAQNLDKALLQFAAQAHVQMSFAWDSSTAKLRTHQLKGTYTGRQALDELLRGTHLRYVARKQTVEILPQQAAHLGHSAESVRPTGISQRANSTKSIDSERAAIDPPATSSGSSAVIQDKALTEVIVTAQKYSQRAFDVPISLQVVTAQELEDQGITDLSDLQYDVPGLYMNSTGLSRSIYIRGVANTFGTGPMVGQYIDDADITVGGSNGGSGYVGGDNGLYDLARVEVLKGPQGTLYGDGSIGGVIRYITNQPVLDRVQMSADAAASLTEYGAPSQNIEGMLNTPIISGILGLRLAGMFEHQGGWVDEPAASLKNINGSNLTDIRIEARWQPTGSLAVNAMQVVHRHDWGLGTGEDSSGNITPLFGTTFTPNGTDNSSISNVTATYTFSEARLLSSSTYTSEHQDLYNLYASETIPPPTVWLLEPSFNASSGSVNEELRLASSSAGSWRWTLGGFYKHSYGVDGGDAYEGLGGSTLSSAFYIPESENNGGDSSTSLAGFLDTSYNFFHRLTLGTGARYYRDRESNSNSGVTFGNVTFTSVDPRFYVQYALTPYINTYANASKGFRSGGFNFAPTEPAFNPETLWSYELGSKFRFPEQTLHADASLFYMNYSNYVAYDNVTPTLTIETNVGKARIKGVDADVTWEPISGWVAGLNTEIVDSEFITAIEASGYTSGNRLPLTPSYSFTSSIEREFRWNGRPSSLEIYYYEISRVQFRQPGIPLTQSDVLRFLNFRLGVQWSENLSLGVFGHNLLNDRGNESPFAFENWSTRPRPRTLGVDFQVRL